MLSKTLWPHWDTQLHQKTSAHRRHRPVYAYYNDNDPFVCQWLRNLMDEELIAPGIIDPRSITEVGPNDLAGYDRCHFFAGVAGWELALQLAGWPNNIPCWTASCPCQPYSSAGMGLGDRDPRNLWPHVHRLIAQCRPPVVFGEQVETAVRHGWLDGVFAGLEKEDYACGAAVLGAHSIGAPHVRQRLYWVAHATGQRLGSGREDCSDVTSSMSRPRFESAWTDYCQHRVSAEPGAQPLAHGIPAELGRGEPEVRRLVRAARNNWRGRLKAYGNAIVPELAAAFIRSAIEAWWEVGDRVMIGNNGQQQDINGQQRRLLTNGGHAPAQREDVAGRLTGLAQAIRCADEEIRKSMRAALQDTLSHAKKVGELLVEARTLCRQKDVPWESWPPEQCDVSLRTAQVYIRIAKNWEKIMEAQSSAPLSIDGALKLLRKPKTSTPAGESNHGPVDPTQEPDDGPVAPNPEVSTPPDEKHKRQLAVLLRRRSECTKEILTVLAELVAGLHEELVGVEWGDGDKRRLAVMASQLSEAALKIRSVAGSELPVSNAPHDTVLAGNGDGVITPTKTALEHAVLTLTGGSTSEVARTGWKTIVKAASVVLKWHEMKEIIAAAELAARGMEVQEV